MLNSTDIRFTIIFNDPDFDPEECDQLAQQFLNQLKEMDEVTASRVYDSRPPVGNKAGGGYLVGLLTAEVKKINTKPVLDFFLERLSNKTIELKVEANGKKLELKASNSADLEIAISMAKKFIGDGSV